MKKSERTTENEGEKKLQEIKIRELVIDNVVGCTLMDGDHTTDEMPASI